MMARFYACAERTGLRPLNGQARPVPLEPMPLRNASLHLMKARKQNMRSFGYNRASGGFVYPYLDRSQAG